MVFCTILLFFILVNGVLALLIRSLPSKLFDETRRLYRVIPCEKRLYKKLKIYHWKNILPQAGWMTGFSRKQLPKTIKLTYVEKFIWEICCSMFGHTIMALMGLLAPLLAFFPWMDGNKELLWGLGILHFIIQLLYVMIQRYNLPRFIKIKERLSIT